MNKGRSGEPVTYRKALPPAVVAGATQTAVVLMRDLARQGVPVCCIDMDRASPGFKTIYGDGHLCPNPDTAPEEWLSFMRKLARSLDSTPVLICAADQFVSAIAHHSQPLMRDYAFCHTGMGVQSLLATKQRQYEIASQNGLDVPRTVYARSLEEIELFGSSASFPCVMKPTHARHWEDAATGHPLRSKKLVVANSQDELARYYKVAAQLTSDVVVQEVIEGPDTLKLVYLSCYGTDGRRIAAHLVRQLRTWPIHFGSASVVEPVCDLEADLACDSFLRRLGYQGICEIELKRDKRDGKLKMIEANPRYSVTADAASCAGLALGWLHYLDLVGAAVDAPVAAQRKVRHVVLRRDFATIGSYVQAGLFTWSQWIGTFRPPVAYFDFDARDWRVTLGTIKSIVGGIARGIVRRLFSAKGAAAINCGSPETINLVALERDAEVPAVQ